MILKGGISTKPSITRILGLTPSAPAMAVERERPLDPEQTAAKTVFLATKAMLRAVEGATSLPFLVLAPLGIAASWSSREGRRYWLLLGTILGFCALAMIRLHATAGYCTPRHAMVAAWTLIPAAAAGLNRLIGPAGHALIRFTRGLAPPRMIEAAVRLVILCGLIVIWGPAAVAKIDPGFTGYRQAGEWIASSAGRDELLIDPKGFSLYYAGKHGYTFATLGQGIHDPAVRFVVAHEALIFGPWGYSKAIRDVVDNRQPVRIFPAKPERGVSKVYVYDLSQPSDRTAGPLENDPRIRR
jgi:hypothetical protein